jgi:SulP family sulfate permease
VAVILLIPAAGLLKDVPLATLAAVLIFVATRVFRTHDLVAIAKFDRIEFALAIVTLLTVALIGVEQGIGVAVGLAILDRTRLTARPTLHILGRIPGTTSWTPLGAGQPAAPVPSVMVVLFSTPLWYANAIHFRTAIGAMVQGAGGPPKVFVLDTIGMNDLDFTGSRALTEVLNEMDRLHITFALARVGFHLRESLKASGLLARIGEEHLYATADEAVTALAPPPPA